LTQLAKRPIKSFSIGFDERPFNEINYARIAAKAFGAEHYEYFVTPQDACDVIPILVESFDEPFGNASAIPTYFCAKTAAEHGVDILYAGDGGDELFAGNERYATQRLFDYYGGIPLWLRNLVVKPTAFALADALKWNFFVKGKKYIERASIPYPERLFSYGFFRIVPLAEFLEYDFLEAIGKNYDPYRTITSYYFQAPAGSELDRQLYIDLKLAIMDNDLFKVTRMSEEAGVAVRFPFLDQRVAEFAATIPANVKMRGRKLRSFFKKAYSDLLPREILNKKKHGFGLPIPLWLRTNGHLNEMMQDMVLSSRAQQRGYFRKKALAGLVKSHKVDETSFYGTVLWNLMVLELWHRRYCDSTLN
jgi:asparagine synthase (glutamine-hydrolysing)